MEQNSSTVDKEEIIGTMAKDLNLEKVEPKGEHYSEFETLYESVLFKKPELLTIKVFANAMDELKVRFIINHTDVIYDYPIYCRFQGHAIPQPSAQPLPCTLYILLNSPSILSFKKIPS